MSIRDGWKEAGKGIGKSFAGLGKAILKSAKVGVDKALDEDHSDNKGGTGLSQSWSEVGHDFGKAGVSLGKAFAGTASGVLEKLEDEAEEAAEAEPAVEIEFDETAEAPEGEAENKDS